MVNVKSIVNFIIPLFFFNHLSYSYEKNNPPLNSNYFIFNMNNNRFNKSWYSMLTVYESTSNKHFGELYLSSLNDKKDKLSLIIDIASIDNISDFIRKFDISKNVTLTIEANGKIYHSIEGHIKINKLMYGIVEGVFSDVKFEKYPKKISGYFVGKISFNCFVINSNLTDDRMGIGSKNNILKVGSVLHPFCQKYMN